VKSIGPLKSVWPAFLISRANGQLSVWPLTEQLPSGAGAFVSCRFCGPGEVIRQPRVPAGALPVAFAVEDPAGPIGAVTVLVTVQLELAATGAWTLALTCTNSPGASVTWEI
jgi:hypothetical protein